MNPNPNNASMVKVENEDDDYAVKWKLAYQRVKENADELYGYLEKGIQLKRDFKALQAEQNAAQQNIGTLQRTNLDLLEQCKALCAEKEQQRLRIDQLEARVKSVEEERNSEVASISLELASAQRSVLSGEKKRDEMEAELARLKRILGDNIRQLNEALGCTMRTSGAVLGLCADTSGEMASQAAPPTLSSSVGHHAESGIKSAIGVLNDPRVPVVVMMGASDPGDSIPPSSTETRRNPVEQLQTWQQQASAVAAYGDENGAPATKRCRQSPMETHPSDSLINQVPATATERIRSKDRPTVVQHPQPVSTDHENNRNNQTGTRSRPASDRGSNERSRKRRASPQPVVDGRSPPTTSGCAPIAPASVLAQPSSPRESSARWNRSNRRDVEFRPRPQLEPQGRAPAVAQPQEQQHFVCAVTPRDTQRNGTWLLNTLATWGYGGNRSAPPPPEGDLSDGELNSEGENEVQIIYSPREGTMSARGEVQEPQALVAPPLQMHPVDLDPDVIRLRQMHGSIKGLWSSVPSLPPSGPLREVHIRERARLALEESLCKQPPRSHCAFCGYPGHFHQMCPEVFTVQARWNHVRAESLCEVCLTRKYAEHVLCHTPGNREHRTCPICGGNHSRALCADGPFEAYLLQQHAKRSLLGRREGVLPHSRYGDGHGPS